MPPAFKDEAVRVKVPENIGSGFHPHGIGVESTLLIMIRKIAFGFDDDTENDKND